MEEINETGIKYLTPEQQLIVKNELKTMNTDRLIFMKPLFSKGGLKTCLRLLEEELASRQAKN